MVQRLSQQSDGRRREAPEAVSRGREREGGSPSTSVPKRWFGGTTPEKILNFISKMVHFRAFGGKLSNAIELVDTAVYIFEKDIAAKAFRHVIARVCSTLVLKILN